MYVLTDTIPRLDNNFFLFKVFSINVSKIFTTESGKEKLSLIPIVDV